MIMKRAVTVTSVIIMLLITVTFSAYARADKNVNVAPDAKIDAPECKAEASVSALCDGKYPDVSYQQTAYDCYNSHDYLGPLPSVDDYAAYDNVETITFTWENDVTVGSVHIVFVCTAPTREVWCMFGGADAPAYYEIEYLSNGEYVSVVGDGYGVARDTVNVTEFDTVTTRSIRITMTKLTDAERVSYVDGEAAVINGGPEGLVYRYLGIGVAEIMVYTAEPNETPTLTETNAIETGKHETTPEQTTKAPEKETTKDTTKDTEKETDAPIQTSDVDTDPDAPEVTTDTDGDGTVADTIETADTETESDEATETVTDTSENHTSAHDTLYLNDGSAFDDGGYGVLWHSWYIIAAIAAALIAVAAVTVILLKYKKY